MKGLVNLLLSMPVYCPILCGPLVDVTVHLRFVFMYTYIVPTARPPFPPIYFTLSPIELGLPLPSKEVLLLVVRGVAMKNVWGVCIEFGPFFLEFRFFNSEFGGFEPRKRPLNTPMLVLCPGIK